MKFPEVEIWKAAGKQRYVRYDADANVIVAADGYILAVLGVIGDVPEQSVNIPAQSLEAAYKLGCSLSIEDGYAVTLDGVMYPLNDDSYMDWQSIVERQHGEEDCIRISFDVSLLSRLVEAINRFDSGVVTLVVGKDRTGPIKVLGNTAWGLIMPVEKIKK